ncbi:MAG TPA: hypothetical protein VG963_10550, partial [Polyangiaceae bacterium]|nr:hypothetical protein [Polyangiaceae bacterium]
CLPLHFDQPTMLAGWAPGGQDFVLPPDVGEENPAPGSTLMVEWHYFNNANSALADRSAVRICTVPQDKRPHVASITWLGTEDIGGLIGMPPGQKSSYSGVCNPGRMGLSAQDSIHLLYATPHMHQYGRHTQITIQRATGGSDTVLDQPFSDRQQIFYPIDADVLPGDSIQTTCSYENTSDRNIPWGSPFGDGEMCYAFVLHYPAHSLDNGASSVLGASNTCW